MSEEEARAYHHVFDEPDSDHVVLTWPRTIPMREGDRGWSDMQMIERRLPELAGMPMLLLWAPGDEVFPIEYAHRLKELLPHAEGPDHVRSRARIFCRTIAGPDLAAAIVAFLKRTLEANMKFVTSVRRGAVATLRADPLLWEQELDVRPEFAEALERAVGNARRPGLLAQRARSSVCDGAGRSGARAAVDGDGSMAFWDRYEPRPPEHEIDADLFDFCLWLAEIGGPGSGGCFAESRSMPGSSPGGRRGRCCGLPTNASAICRVFRMSPVSSKSKGCGWRTSKRADGDPILMLHGEPTWGYFYRHMIPTASGGRPRDRAGPDRLRAIG